MHADRAAELEAALARALSDLKLATDARRKLNATSPGVLEAVRREREVMERNPGVGGTARGVRRLAIGLVGGERLRVSIAQGLELLHE